MEWYLGVLKKYAVFDGRARRKEYWMFLLFNMVAALVLLIIDNIIAGIKVANGDLNYKYPFALRLIK